MEKKRQPALYWLVLLWVAIIGVWLLSAWLLYGREDRGTLGDMFGAVNALFTGLAFGTLIYTTWMQRDELALQRQELKATRDELSGQKKQLEIQSNTLQLQQFENSFFELLKYQRQIGYEITLIDESVIPAQTYRGKDCFGHSFTQREWQIRGSQMHDPFSERMPHISSAIDYFFNNDYRNFEPYFRSLHWLVKYVDAASLNEKYKPLYITLLRNELTSQEQGLLYLTCIDKRGDPSFKLLVEKYALLKGIDRQLLDVLAEKGALCSASAFGE